MEQNKSTSDNIPAWTLTRDEYKNTAQAWRSPKESVLTRNLDLETAETLKRFRIKELSALSRVLGARRSGKKGTIIASILSRHCARVALEAETTESLQSMKVVEIDALLKNAGLAASCGNKEAKTWELINWRDEIRTTAKERLAESKHVLEVSDAIMARKYHGAIAEGQMTKERAAQIITSADLDVDKHLSTKEPETKRKGGRATRALENAEIRVLFAKIDGRYSVRNRAMLMVGIHIALRATELCGLTVADVYDGENVRTYITIRGEIAKGGKQRTVRMSSDVRRALDGFIRWKLGCHQSIEADAPLFVSQMGGHLSRKMLYQITSTLLRSVGIDQSPHCLRKTGATIYYTQSDYDVIATQHFLGHTDPSHTRAYIGITPQQTVSYSEKSGKQLLSAIKSGEIEKLDTSVHMSNFPDSGIFAENQRMREEQVRKDKVIDRLLALTEEYGLPVLGKEVSGDDKVIPIDIARRRRGR